MVGEHRDDLSQGISIWFFIGTLLAVYGVIILVANLVPGAGGPESRVVLASLHAGIWWGGVLVAVGVMYVLVFRPGRK
jgi:hypothetical protein